MRMSSGAGRVSAYDAKPGNRWRCQNSTLGNEQADNGFAKKGSHLQQTKFSVLSFRSIRLHIKTIIEISYGSQFQKIELNQSIGILRGSPCNLQQFTSGSCCPVASDTGHDCLAEHLYRIEVISNPGCRL
ncbi:hypothetical protein TNCV_1288261 [Trichonephila clavipes]|nr:hypothetical protein TNCV_1288261 [Trichonephila clavipes]